MQEARSPMISAGTSALSATKSCSLCSIGEREVPVLTHPIGLAVPSVGALVEGWLLLIPHRHVLSLVELDWAERAEFGHLVDAAIALVQAQYGPIVLFEHGPSMPERTAGCGIDHAHMHVVPTSADLRSETQALDISPTTLRWRAAKAVWDAEQEHGAGLDYLYLKAADGSEWVASASCIPSQLFRRAIAGSIGQETWDWKADPHTDLVDATRRRLLS